MTSSPQHIDRRVQRTHEALLESLRQLMSERGYERLTIQNLLDHAGVSRATFYAHFSSKDDLLTTSIAVCGRGCSGKRHHEVPANWASRCHFSCTWRATSRSTRGASGAAS